MIRKAKYEDINSILELLKEVNKVHYDIRPDLFNLTTKYSSDELKLLINNCNKPIFVYDDNGKILGHAFTIIENKEDNKLLKPIKTLYIDDICIKSSERGKHIGKKIYEFIEEYAKDIGCYNITLNVWCGNDGAYKFYESIGLKPYKIGMEKIIK